MSKHSKLVLEIIERDVFIVTLVDPEEDLELSCRDGATLAEALRSIADDMERQAEIASWPVNEHGDPMPPCEGCGVHVEPYAPCGSPECYAGPHDEEQAAADLEDYLAKMDQNPIF